MREVLDLISNIRPEGWLETDTQMVYHTAESKWGGDGVPENDMVGIKQGSTNKTPTNADCIKYLYGYKEIDDPKIPDTIYYRPILPKPPVVIRISPPRNTSGSRLTPGQKKKK